MDKIILLPIIFVVALLIIGLALASAEIVKDSSPDDAGKINNDTPSGDREDSNKILNLASYKNTHGSNDFDNPFFNYHHDVIIS